MVLNACAGTDEMVPDFIVMSKCSFNNQAAVHRENKHLTMFPQVIERREPYADMESVQEAGAQCAREQYGLFPVEKSMTKIQQTHMQVESERKPMCLQQGTSSCVHDDLYPEQDIAQCVTVFLNERSIQTHGMGRYLTSDTDMGNYALRLWLYKAFMFKPPNISEQDSDISTYPFLVEVSDTEVVWQSHKYYQEIAKVMSRLIGIFEWESKQSKESPSAVEGWKKEERYPNMKKILHSWKQGPFPQSFCDNIIFFMKNRVRLECFGCDMTFLDQCRYYLPDSLNPFMPGALKYREFYRDVFCNKQYRSSIERLLTSCLFEVAHDCAFRPVYPYARYVAHYTDPLKSLRKLMQNMPKKDDAVWLCNLAEGLLIAEIVLGKRPELVISIQGIAAYINDQMEYVQFIPSYKGLCTKKLNDLVTSITGGESDLGLSFLECEVTQSSVVYPLHQKTHGLQGIHPHVEKNRWVSCAPGSVGFTCPERSQEAYKHYQEFFDSDRVITKDDLLSLEHVIKADLWSCPIRFENIHSFCVVLPPIVSRPEKIHEVEFQNPLLLAIRAHIKQVFLTMQQERGVILKMLKNFQTLSENFQVECDVQAAQLPGEISQLRAQIDERSKDFKRKREILLHVCERLHPVSDRLLSNQPVIMIVLFLRSLGVVVPHLPYTNQEAHDIIATIIDDRPFQNDPCLYHCYVHQCGQVPFFEQSPCVIHGEEILPDLRVSSLDEGGQAFFSKSSEQWI